MMLWPFAGGIMCENKERSAEMAWIFEGKFFHLLDDDGYAEWQGRVVAELPNGSLVVELLDWVVGGRSWGKRIIPAADIGRTVLYETDEEMREAYECSGVARPSREQMDEALRGL